MLLPFLTEHDPASPSEGSIDPLGLYPIADALGTKLAPGVRERQSHPRFLTAIAASLSLCSQFDEGDIAKDGKSEPWQVFEWYTVEGLVRTLSEEDQLRGLPGREKTLSAINDKVPLCAKRYLKTPTVFGFHGVYRRLARTLGIEISGRLGDQGYELLRTWSEEQGLDGFCGTSNGEGATWRQRLAKAVQDGLEKGAVARESLWSGWRFFKDHLAHHKIGRKEGKAIQGMLMSSQDGYRRQVLEFLVSPQGKILWQENKSERAFHTALYLQADPDLRQLLEAILVYEEFCRYALDAFVGCLAAMTRARGKTASGEFVSLKKVQEATEKVPVLFDKLVPLLEPFGESVRFQETFSRVAERQPVAHWVETLLDHHRSNQRRKPPNGKAPWYERFDDGTYIIRPAYRQDQEDRYTGEYVHAYRANALWSFARDLGMVR